MKVLIVIGLTLLGVAYIGGVFWLGGKVQDNIGHGPAILTVVAGLFLPIAVAVGIAWELDT